MQTGLAFVGLVGAMAMGMYELFSIVERRTTGWAHLGMERSVSQGARLKRMVGVAF